MVNLLPAVLIGGPPHAGKSVLFYSLTKTLHDRGVHHHAIRACPDGEGNWFHEIHREFDPETLRVIRVKGKWSEDFVQGICRDLQQRHLPLLVDMGGKPQEGQMSILHGCTHSVLLLKPEEQENTRFWRQLLESTSLLPLAQINSERTGVSTVRIDPSTAVIQGTITALERGFPASGQLFDALVERIDSLFSSYSLEELEQAKLALAPTELVVNLDPLLQKLDPLAKAWKPEMLRRLPDELPSETSLAVYGRGPGWLYGMLAAYVGAQPFYQFDPRIGWLAPPTLRISTQPMPEAISVNEREHPSQHAVVLSIRIESDYLDHLQTEQLPFPPVPAESGLILDGKLPHWLLTALVRLYNGMGVAWMACYQPQLQGAVVIVSHTEAHTLGEVIPYAP